MKRLCYGLLRINFCPDGFAIEHVHETGCTAYRSKTLITSIALVWRTDAGCWAEGFGELWGSEARGTGSPIVSYDAVIRPLGSARYE